MLSVASDTMLRRRMPMSRRRPQTAWVPELKVRTLLAAGECHDLLGDRRAAVKDYQAAIDAGPNTSRADTAHKRLKSPYHGN